MKNEPSVKHLIDKSFRLAINNMWRNKLLSFATIFVVGTIIFIFNILIALNFIAGEALADLNKKVDITVYLQDSTTYEQVQSLKQELISLPGVENITYVSKDEALKILKSSHPDLSLAFEKYNLGNPLPASLNIVSTKAEFHQQIAEFLAQDKYRLYLSSVNQSGNLDSNAILSSISKNLIKLTVFTNQLIFWLILTFVIGGALVILNAIQITIFARKKEIGIMKLVGASNWFIRSPFIIESILYGLLALILSFIMLILLSSNLSINDSSLNFSFIFFIEFVLTIALSVLSSTIAIREYMKKDLLEE